MLLRHQLAVGLVALGAMGATESIVGVPRAWAWNPFHPTSGAMQTDERGFGKGLGEGSVDAIQPALLCTVGTVSRAASDVVADIDVRLSRQLGPASGVAGRLLSQTKGATDDSLDRIDHILEKRLLGVQTSVDGRAERLGAPVDASLRAADQILRQRGAQVDSLVSLALQQADQALEARIQQIDNDVSVRLGNVDVVAIKQRLGLEEIVLRTLLLLGLVAFAVYVVRSLWKAFASVRAKAGDRRGIHRTIHYVRGFAKRLALPLVAAAVAALVFWIIHERLPLGARHRAQQLTAMQQREMKASLARFDFSRARFYASQLELLQPEQGAYYQAMANKASLLRDLITRPALLATPQAVSQVVERVHAVQRELGDRADPDILTMKAMVLWRVGDSKRDEHEAASYCARALRLSPGGFALAPLARHYIRAFVQSPYIPADAPYGRNAESLQDLRELGSSPAERDAGFPLAPMLELDRLIARLDRTVTPAYVDMLNAHADVVRLATESPDAKAARERRTDAARRVLAAWRSFDGDLEQIPGLIGKNTVLAVFRLDDASFTRAAWFAERPTDTALAPLLGDISDVTLKTKLASPRTVWQRRYGGLIARELQSVAELQEADRFLAFERKHRDFEQAYVAFRAAEPGADKEAKRRLSAILAGRLGLYINEPGRRGRIPFASSLARIEEMAQPSEARSFAEALETRGIRTL